MPPRIEERDGKISPRFDLEAGENDSVMQLKIKIVWFLEVAVVKRFLGKKTRAIKRFYIGVAPFTYFAITR